MTRKPICPIGLDCPVEGFSQCPNLRTCKNQTFSWDIPYEKRPGELVVKRYGRRQEWSEQDTCYGEPMNRCSIPSGQYLPRSYDRENKERLQQAWEQAGWKAAEQNPHFQGEENDDDDDSLIPF